MCNLYKKIKFLKKVLIKTIDLEVTTLKINDLKGITTSQFAQLSHLHSSKLHLFIPSKSHRLILPIPICFLLS